MKVAIIDYGSGNVFSVSAALKRLGVNAVVTADSDVIKSSDAVIFPGVGHAKFAMEQLKETGLDQLIPTLEQPVLGICLGMQLMCSFTEEGDVACLNIFPNVNVRKFVDSPKIPHMGWNKLENGKGLFTDTNSDVYFVHSYYAELNEFTVSESDYGSIFTASMQKDNFYGCQFHPEKSGKSGEKIIADFLKMII
jgi:glutamine amidotransferase